MGTSRIQDALNYRPGSQREHEWRTELKCHLKDQYDDKDIKPYTEFIRYPLANLEDSLEPKTV